MKAEIEGEKTKRTKQMSFIFSMTQANKPNKHYRGCGSGRVAKTFTKAPEAQL